MKRIVLFLIIAVVFLLSSCTPGKTDENFSITAFTEVKNSTENTNAVAGYNKREVTQTRQKNITEKQQTHIYISFLKEKLEKDRDYYNSRFVKGELFPFDVAIKEKYYSFYDVDGDGKLELLTGSKNESYIKEFLNIDNVGSVIIENIAFIDGTEVKFLKDTLFIPENTAGIPILYGNRLLRVGGIDYNEGLGEYYTYSSFRNGKLEHRFFLAHSFKEGENMEIFKLVVLSSGKTSSENFLSKEKYLQKKAEFEKYPINDKLKWYAEKELIVFEG